MIKKQAIDNFLKRERDDFRPWKQITDSKLERLYANLPGAPPQQLWDKMRRVQRVCFLLIATLREHKFALHLDTGTGKTLVAIALTRYAGQRGRVFRTLVLVPRNVNKSEWVRELKKHVPHESSWVMLTGSSKKKWQLLEEADDEFVICTYSGLAHMVSKRAPTKKGKEKLVPNAALVERLMKSVDGLICDEATEVSSRATLAWRICRKLAQSAGTVIELTGTPFGRDPTPLWSQMYLVDNGHTLGENLGLFRAALFKQRDNYWSGFPEFTFDKKKKAVLHRLIAHRSIRFEANEADLPKCVRITKEVTIAHDVQEYYDKARQQLIDAHGNYNDMKNAFVRMRQIAAGFLGYYDDEIGEKAQFEFPDNPKLEMTVGLVESVYQRHKAVVFHDFNYSGSMLARELKKIGVPFTWVYGKTKDPDKALNDFINDDECRVLLMSSAGSAGLNLQIARYLFFFESPVPVITRKQTERRVERQFSEHDTVFIYDVVARGTFDARILKAHREGADLFKAIIDGKERA